MRAMGVEEAAGANRIKSNLFLCFFLLLSVGSASTRSVFNREENVSFSVSESPSHNKVTFRGKKDAESC